MLSDPNGMKLEINNRKRAAKNPEFAIKQYT